MLQAHSFLWHYLWVAPNILLLGLGILLWRRGVGRQFPAFCVFATLSAICHLALYVADIAPWVSSPAFWRVDWGSLLTETLLKFVVIAAVFSNVFQPYPSVSRLGKLLVRGLGGILVLTAAIAAGFARPDNIYGLISGAHLLEQTVLLIVSGIILSLFLMAAYFHLRLDRASFGILLGLGISSCVHLATWAVMANATVSVHGRTLFDFLNMATYHVCVLIWFYYLLTPDKVVGKPTAP